MSRPDDWSGRCVGKYQLAKRLGRGAVGQVYEGADDVTHDFPVRMLGCATLAQERLNRGRFRDYLKAALRNAATDHFHK